MPLTLCPSVWLFDSPCFGVAKALRRPGVAAGLASGAVPGRLA